MGRSPSEAEIEAVGRALCAHANLVEKNTAAREMRRAVFLTYEDWRDEYDAEAEAAIAALDAVRWPGSAARNQEAAREAFVSATDLKLLPSQWRVLLDKHLPAALDAVRGTDDRDAEIVRLRAEADRLCSRILQALDVLKEALDA